MIPSGAGQQQCIDQEFSLMGVELILTGAASALRAMSQLSGSRKPLESNKGLDKRNILEHYLAGANCNS